MFCGNFIVDIYMCILYVEDIFFFIIVVFIGYIYFYYIYLYFFFYFMLIEMICEIIDVVCIFFIVVEIVGCNICIWFKWFKEIENFYVVKDYLYDVVGQLVESVEIVVNVLFEEVVEEGYEKEKVGLLGVVIGMLRVGIECVWLVRICVLEDEIIYFNVIFK